MPRSIWNGLISFGMVSIPVKLYTATEARLNWWYADEELAEWLPRIERLSTEAEEVYLAFNTKFEDQGVVNARRLQALLG